MSTNQNLRYWGGKVWRLYLKKVANFVELLPLILPAAIAAFGAIATVLLLFGELSNLLVCVIGLPAAAFVTFVIVRYCKKTDRPGSIKEQRIVDLLAVLGVILWALLNIQYTSQNIYVNRDPAIYTVAGAWLVDEDNLDITVPKMFGYTDGIRPTGFGFDVKVNDSDKLYVQGLHLLPIFVGLAGRVAGESAMLHTNPLFGGVALLAVYGFGRLLVRPRWALLATGVVGVSLPMIVFSRDTYTEPLAALLTFGALALLWAAQQNKSLLLWLVAGLTLGAGALTRIDAYIAFIAIAAFFAVFLALAKKTEKKERLAQTGVYAVGVGITALIGWLDVSQLSSSYYNDLAPQFKQQILVLAAVIVLGAVAVALCWKIKILKVLDKMTKNWRAQAAIIFILLISLFLVSRPLWYVSHNNSDVPLIRGLQMARGNPPDGTRDYAEQTTNWIAWYIGSFIALASVGGAAMLAAGATRRKDLLLVPGLLVIIGTSLVFLNIPSIVPDQIWASRRLLPVILPGIAIFGAVALERLFARKKLTSTHKKLAVPIVLLLVFVTPVSTTLPYLQLRTYVPQLGQLNAACNILPDNAAVVWVGDMRLYAVHSTRAFCDVPAVGAAQLAEKDLKEISESTRRQGYEPFVLVDSNELDKLPATSSVEPLSSIKYFLMPNTLYSPPRKVITTSRALSIGVVDENGNIVGVR